MKYGYYLVTDLKKDQTNIDMLLKECDNDVVSDQEYYNNKYPNRKDLFDKLGYNDTLIVYQLSHLAESMKKFRAWIDKFIEKSITLISINENINTANNNLNQEDILKLRIELESGIRSRRTVTGLKYARKDGIKGGRRKGLSPASLKKAKEVAKEWESNPDINYVMKVTGVPKASVYRYTELMGVRNTKKRTK